MLQHLPLLKWRTQWKDYSHGEQIACLKEAIHEMISSQIISSPQADSLSYSSIVQLLNSQVGEKLFTSEQIRKEVPFTIHLKPINKEPLLIQGIIDVLIINAGTVEILDYKTDKINHTNGELQLLKNYSLQMAIYAYATEFLLKLPVQSCIIYSFDLERGITLTRSQWQQELFQHFTIV